MKLQVTLPQIALFTSLFLVGCGSKNAEETTNEEEIVEEKITIETSRSTLQSKRKQPKLAADAGVPVNVATKPLVMASGEAADIHPRYDPFGLLPNEIRYRTKQETERIVGQIGGFLPVRDLPEKKPKAPPIFESQPDRKYIGLIVAGGIIGMIKMEDGRIYSLQPGEQIPRSEWSLAYIDSTKAIIRRGGDKLPKEVILPIQGLENTNSKVKIRAQPNQEVPRSRMKIQPPKQNFMKPSAT